MTPLLIPTHLPQCPKCHRGVGMRAFAVIVTGRVAQHPHTPDGLDYPQCRSCGWFVRCEVPPPENSTQAA